ncbi:RTA1-domain-containing protein [Ganoderma leucocontextum]|nr:RTA1-domain-containing protein [Ganoderma leucocontextum]
MSTTTTSTLSSSVPSTSSTQQPVPAHHHNPYGYVATEWICILFIALFAVSTSPPLAALVATPHRSARLWSSQNVYLNDPFIMQITTTIIAPIPLIAANFVILGQIIRRIGQKHSHVSAKWYTIIFCAAGGHIMLAGVSFQMAALVVCVVLASEFILRCAYHHPFERCGESMMARRKTDKKIKLMLLGLVLEAVFLFVRGIYRVVTGKIITTEWYFVVFDGTMIMLAMWTLNIFHPGLLLGKAYTASRGRAKRTSSRSNGNSTNIMFDGRTFCRLATPHSTRTLTSTLTNILLSPLSPLLM